MVSILGVAGAVLVPVAWLYRRYDAYRDREVAAVDLRGVAAVTVGSALLAVHAFAVRDPVFIVFAVAMTLFAGTELGLLAGARRNGEPT